MEDQLKETISSFLKTDAAGINSATVISRSALGNSILLHRMYAKFLQQGFEVNNYNTIETYGDLVSCINGKNSSPKTLIDDEIVQRDNSKTTSRNDGSTLALQNGLGIDIEDLSNFDRTDDYREHPFYRSNFTQSEISYCLLQNNPLLSLAGLFAAKEAIVKADNSYLGIQFNLIAIEHTAQGKPFHKNFIISISHTMETAIAVAFLPPTNISFLPNQVIGTSHQFAQAQKVEKGQKISIFHLITFLLALLSLIISVVIFFKR